MNKRADATSDGSTTCWRQTDSRTLQGAWWSLSDCWSLCSHFRSQSCCKESKWSYSGSVWDLRQNLPLSENYSVKLLETQNTCSPWMLLWDDEWPSFVSDVLIESSVSAVCHWLSICINMLQSTSMMACRWISPDIWHSVCFHLAS